ncbi:4-pyridoxate dehydrogenase-like [Dermacentor andersoni]|uniref:4-pyridoxate dehydrogenase-like n=1 Tax=Dermacentor andersoni TaxID=34620 RepID=UPI003B3BDE25
MCTVGAGSAGCVLANRLTADGSARVLLLEAGGLEDEAAQVPFFSPLLQRTVADWDYASEPQSDASYGYDDNINRYPRGKVLGGSSSINHLISARGNKRDYDTWKSEYGAVGWSYDDVLPFFKDIESSDLGYDDEYHGFSGEVPVSFPTYHTLASDVFLQAGEEIGYKQGDYNGENQNSLLQLLQLLHLLQARILETKATIKRLANDIFAQRRLENQLPIEFHSVLLHANSTAAATREKRLDPPEHALLSCGLKYNIGTRPNVGQLTCAVEQAVRLVEPSLREEARSRAIGVISKVARTNPTTLPATRKRLQENEDIVILPADKGNATVILDRVDYVNKINELLQDTSTNAKLARDPTKKVESELQKLLTEVFKFVSPERKNVYYSLLCQNGSAPALYGLPKIHKPDVPVRPIVDYTCSPLYELSGYLHRVLRPLVELTPTFVKDSAHFIELIRSTCIGDDEVMISFEVLFEGSTAIGVEYNRYIGSRTVRAKREVILSAGAIGSAQLLMLSGIGPRLDLEALQMYDGLYKRKRGEYVFQVVPVLLRPESTGFLKLRNADPKEYPIIDPKFLSTDADRDTIVEEFPSKHHGRNNLKKWGCRAASPAATVKLREGVRLAVQTLSTEAMKKANVSLWQTAVPGCEDTGPVWSDSYLHCFVRQTSQSGWHPCCTAPMGAHPEAVLDARLRVRGNISRLRVVDASSMPSLISGNLNFPIMMMGNKAAVMIIEENA